MTLDVRLKFIIILFSNYLLLRRVPVKYEVLFIIGLMVLFILAKRTKKAVIYAAIYVSLLVVSEFILEHTQGGFYTFLSMITVGGRMMLPCLIAGSYLLSTSRISQIINALRLWRIPEAIILTFAVMLRFFPVIKQDFHTIQQSLKIRGIFSTRYAALCSPLRYGEYVLIPLIMSASRTAQDLTIATMTKSIAGKNKSMYHRPHYTRLDGIISVGLCLLLISIEWHG